MKFTESMLTNYSQPLSATEDGQCKNAIRMVADALKTLGFTDDNAAITPLYTDTFAYSLQMRRSSDSRNIKLFVQGSYANNTNVRTESDVDDLPWNPMKIEQRCGRVDRIGQQRDVHIYNFIVGETVENRVREVLEEKLSVILKEMGVDKYSDVLDSEVAECDFTDVYMRSIGHASQVEKNLYPVEAEMKQQLTNAQKYKDVIREEKDLTKLVGTESNFDVDGALRTMLTYYECWQGHDPRLIDRISIADEEITRHLKTELVQDRTAPLMSIQIDNFPNEEGYFMLWELSISEKESGKRILPIFVNSAMVLRPMAGKRIMDVFLDGNSKLRVSSASNVDAEIYSKLEKSCMDFAYDTFVELKEKQMQQNEESFKKYMYALELRQEAAEHIGIENIRRSRLQKLQKEKANIEAQHRKGSQVYPDFRLIMMARLEA